jgi:membrane-bound lytic murein transglycosylase A
LKLTWGQLGDGVAELIGLLPRLDAEPDLLAKRFVWFKIMPATLLTGYYEPWLEASLSPDAEYRYPLYGKPDDLKTVDLGKFHYRWKGQTLTYRMEDDRIVPYHDREAIDGEGVLSDAGKEIAWVKNPVDIFFLQIQGSGRMVLPDGSVRHILYSGRNGRKFVAIGKLLLRQGIIPREEMSMQRIRQFLNENPEKAKELMFKDPSYVFFTLSDTGPYGTIHSILTPKVSVAVDRTVVPLGSVLALNTALMDYDTGRADPFFSLVLAQDTGGAIKGTRLDLFCGSGDDAEYLAGHLQEQARAFMLVSRRVVDAKNSSK